MFTNPEMFEAKDPPKRDFPKFVFFFGKAATKQEIEKMQEEEPVYAMFKARVMYFHQQLYIVFVISAIGIFIGGKFFIGLLILIWEQIKSFVNFVTRNLIKLCKFIGF